MRIYEVFVTDKANEDLNAIYDYIASRLGAPDAATNQHSRIVDAIITLEEMPRRIKLMSSSSERSKGLRLMVVDKYSIIFMIKGQSVFVVRVLYSSSDIDRRLEEES